MPKIKYNNRINFLTLKEDDSVQFNTRLLLEKLFGTFQKEFQNQNQFLSLNDYVREFNQDLNDVEKIKKIGKGGFGTVYQMKQKLTNRIVAVKKCDYETVEEKSVFDNEYQMMQNIYRIVSQSSPSSFIHIVQPLGFFLNENKDEAYLVMEYCENGDLRQYVENMKKSGTEISDKKCWEFVGSIASAIHQLHSNRIIHSDLKPENVLLSSDFKVKLTDFGLSRELKPDKDYMTAQAGSMLYLAPELLKISEVLTNMEESADFIQQRIVQTPASDIWSIGGLGAQLLIPSLVANPAIQAAELPIHYQASLRNLIKAMLIKDPIRRITAHDILQVPEVVSSLKKRK
ncbi:MAG: putative Kinase/ NEK / Serine/threonine protein kinase [Streblomastix strix]|uniref:non-specific serine/threonine protein kinase n=1 Tax=Streblomastix strix TaxID=222440 RepID=A0A5J4VUC8_9EUKA|nr:MAG: putative Kinase/ NEK / Serine/threonine protein kinase [Streblomastix strix]